jgi:hypothetical protein
MPWPFVNKYEELAAELSERVDELTEELNQERAKRIASEAIAEERRIRADRSDEYASRAEASRDEAIKLLTNSLGSTNSGLLKAMTPEVAPPRDIKDYTPATPKPKPVQGRRADVLFARQFEQSKFNKNKPKSPDPVLNAQAQMEALNVEALLK